MFQAAVFTPNNETFKAAPRLCLCDTCLSKYGSCEMFKTYQLHCTQPKANFLRSQYQTELTEGTEVNNIGLIIPETFCASAVSSTSADTICCMKIVEKCVAAHEIEDDYGHKISQGQQYVVGNFLERTRSTKKGLLLKKESKKTYFFKESIVYPFVQFSTLKMELYLTNNDFADILAFVEQTGMVSLTSLSKHLKDTIHCLLTLAYAIFCFVPNNFVRNNIVCYYLKVVNLMFKFFIYL